MTPSIRHEVNNVLAALMAEVQLLQMDRLTPEQAGALDRITIPPDALDQISELMSVGASLIISDQGLGPETGKGTDFVVLTR